MAKFSEAQRVAPARSAPPGRVALGFILVDSDGDSDVPALSETFAARTYPRGALWAEVNSRIAAHLSDLPAGLHSVSATVMWRDNQEYSFVAYIRSPGEVRLSEHLRRVLRFVSGRETDLAIVPEAYQHAIALHPSAQREAWGALLDTHEVGN